MSIAATSPPSLWHDTAPARVVMPALIGKAEADLVVIGAGFTGLSAAIEAARRGSSVIVLEGHTVGWGASGRNNGQVIPMLTAAEPDAWVERYGEAGVRMVKLIGGSGQMLFDLIGEFDINAEAEQTGWLQPAHSPGRLKLSAARVAAWQRHGFDLQLKSASEMSELLGSDAWHGGLCAPSGGHINPLALVRGMAKAAEALGVTIHEASRVNHFERNGASWRVQSDAGETNSRAMILATNAYTGELSPQLFPRLARSLIPVVSWQMATDPVSDNVRGNIVPGRQAVSDTRGDLRFYRFDARNRLITGGAVMGSWNQQTRVKRKATYQLAEAYPELGAIEMTHVWSGYVGMNWDRFPRVHKLGQDGYAWAACNGRGVAFGTAMGRELARAATGVPESDLALPFTEPNPFPFQATLRRIAPSYLAWLKRKDHNELTP